MANYWYSHAQYAGDDMPVALVTFLLVQHNFKTNMIQFGDDSGLMDCETSPDVACFVGLRLVLQEILAAGSWTEDLRIRRSLALAIRGRHFEIAEILLFSYTGLILLML